MPPSGYSGEQAEAIQGFLESCARALAVEAAADDAPIAEALAKEVADISRDLSSEVRSGAATSVLDLTRTFYQRVAQRVGQGVGFEDGVAVVLGEISSEIRDVHIAPAQGPELVEAASRTLDTIAASDSDRITRRADVFSAARRGAAAD